MTRNSTDSIKWTSLFDRCTSEPMLAECLCVLTPDHSTAHRFEDLKTYYLYLRRADYLPRRAS